MGENLLLPPQGALASAHSGPEVARLFQVCLSLVLLTAWVSLGSQVQVLIGAQGLLPAADMMARAAGADLSLLQVPTLFWLGTSDGLLLLGVGLGCGLALLALTGYRARLCLGLSAPLYLSYAVVGRDFLAFQWDNMLVETALLAAFVPTHRTSPLSHLLMRLMLFKLYFESGIAKWQSHLGDWHDGSAMTFYYETAPIPTWLAWYGHHLPEGWHHLESWGALVLELLVPFLIFGPARARWIAFLSFTGFQVVNTATANYGFFTYLSFCIHLFLLSDRQVVRARRSLAARLPAWWFEGSDPVEPRAATPSGGAGRRLVTRGLLAAWVACSLAGAVMHFGGSAGLKELAAPLYRPAAELRVANVYRLFGHITRERIEPEFQVQLAGRWQGLSMHYKPGPPGRPPPFVAPHQPRVDFRLWFYGLSAQRGMPAYVDALLNRLCYAPGVVQQLFVEPLPTNAEAVRVRFFRYRMAPERNRLQQAWWLRKELGAAKPRVCLAHNQQDAA